MTSSTTLAITASTRIHRPPRWVRVRLGASPAGKAREPVRVRAAAEVPGTWVIAPPLEWWAG
ncbi:hypothetical protein GCM10009637_12600 [Brevibacterium luteolum]